MRTLKPHEYLAVFIAVTMGILLSYLMFNIFQAICIGIVIGVFTYSFLLCKQEKDSSEKKEE